MGLPTLPQCCRVGNGGRRHATALPRALQQLWKAVPHRGSWCRNSVSGPRVHFILCQVWFAVLARCLGVQTQLRSSQKR